jgi:hypothetical protein
MDLLGAPGAEEMGQTVYANDRGNKRFGVRFVPGDPRREWSPGPTVITYLVDQSDGATANGLTNGDTEGAIDRAMQTWAAVGCSHLEIVKATDTGVDPDLLDFFAGFPGALPGCCVADIVQAGWADWSPLVGAGVLAFTVPFTWTDEDGNETDIDHDGNADAAFAEIYYNHGTYPWGIDSPYLPIDVETVALHETGHGLGQAHFGKIFRTMANGNLHFSPRCVMNAAYTGIQQELVNTDVAGHCGLWASWPGE